MFRAGSRIIHRQTCENLLSLMNSKSRSATGWLKYAGMPGQFADLHLVSMCPFFLDPRSSPNTVLFYIPLSVHLNSRNSNRKVIRQALTLLVISVRVCLSLITWPGVSLCIRLRSDLRLMELPNCPGICPASQNCPGVSPSAPASYGAAELSRHILVNPVCNCLLW